MKTKFGEFETAEKYIEHLESLVLQEQERADHAYDECQKAHDMNQKTLEKMAKIRASFEEIDNEE